VAQDGPRCPGRVAKKISTSPFHDEAVNALVQRVSETRRDEVEDFLLERIAQDGARKFPLHLRRLGGFCSPKITDALNTLARNPNATSLVVEAALASLIERAPGRGVTAALHIADSRPALKLPQDTAADPGNDVSRRWHQSVRACAALIKSAQCAANLDAILSRLTGSPEFAADVIRRHSQTGPDVSRGWASHRTSQPPCTYGRTPRCLTSLTTPIGRSSMSTRCSSSVADLTEAVGVIGPRDCGSAPPHRRRA
jgi:hypothetical protein